MTRSKRSEWPRRVAWAILGASWLLVVSGPVFAQGRGGGGGMGEGPGKPRDSEGPRDDRPTGTQFGLILSYSGASSGEEEEVLAQIKFKPPGKKSKPFKVVITRSEPVEITLGDRKDFDPEEYPELLTKGLLCRLSWRVVREESGKSSKGAPKGEGKVKARELYQVAFDSLEITGKIAEIGSDSLVIRGKPKNDAQWPDEIIYEDRSKTEGRGPVTVKIKKAPMKRVKLRIWEGATQFQDAAGTQLDVAEFEVGQTVDAKIVYGRGGGIALLVQSLSKADGDESGEDDRQADRGGRGR